MPHRKRIIVIGSGFGGLSAAIRLAACGHEVDVFEKRDQPGGRAYTYSLNGFQFDGGPTVITAPHLFDELFQLAGKNRSDYFQLTPLDPFYKLFDANGDSFEYWRNHEQSIAEVARISPSDAEGYRRFLAGTIDVFRNFYPYTEKPFPTLGSFARILPYVLRTGTWRSMYPYAAQFVKNDFVRRACSFHPLLVGGNPMDTPTIYGLIMQFEREWGIHYATGGTGSIVRSLTRLLEQCGGRLHLNQPVEEIIIRNKKACGIRLTDGTEVAADAVVCNSDVPFTYMNMIAPDHRPGWLNWWIRSMQFSNSLVVLYFGTNKRYSNSALSHHNLLFTDQNYKQQLRQIFSGKQLPKNHTLYLHMPTRTDNTIAPAGCESFYVLSLVPHLGSNINWNEVGSAYNEQLLQYLEENHLPNLRQHIVAQHSINPMHFAQTLNSYKGAAFSIKPTMTQSGYFRPANKSKVFDQLYFVGAGTHPGAGVPAVMASGKIAAAMIEPALQEHLPHFQFQMA